MYAVFHRPDLAHVAARLKELLGATDLSCSSPPEVAVVVGGDGTLLEAVGRHPCLLDSVVVHMGMGKVNFYRSAELAMPVDEVASRILRREYKVVELSTLKSENCVAVNEVAVYTPQRGSLLSFKLIWDEGELAGRADGVIVSTPHGSGGYAASAGGPIVDYRLNAMVVAFVAPYTLYLRPLVLAAGRLEVKAGGEAVVACDGRPAGVSELVAVEPGEKRLKLAVFGEFSYLARAAERMRSL